MIDRKANPVLMAKLNLLLNGLDVDTKKLMETYKEFPDNYRCIGKRVKVADRAFLPPDSVERLFIPDELMLRGSDGASVVKVYYKPDSPYLFTVDNDRKFVIKRKFSGSSPIGVDAHPMMAPHYTTQEIPGLRDPSDYISMAGVDRVTLVPYGGCMCWYVKDPCAFCGGNPKRMERANECRNTVDGAISSAKMGITYQKWWELAKERTQKYVDESLASLIRSDNPYPHFHFLVTAGNFPQLDMGWKITFDLLGSVKNNVDLANVDSTVNLMPPYDLSLIDKLKKDCGVRSTSFNLEVWGKDDFKIVCPNKHRIYSYDRMLEALFYSRDTMGEGNSRTNFVLGAQHEGKMLEGAEYLAKSGVVPDLTIFFPRPGSVWEEREPPSRDAVLDATEKVIKIQQEYGYSPLYCRLSSRSSIANELFEAIL